MICDYHLTIKDRKPYFMQAKTFRLDRVLKALKTLIHYK